MSNYPSVYLIKIHDRPYGFRVVAVVASDEESAKEFCERRFEAQFNDLHKSCFARIEDQCGTSQLESFATLTAEE